MVRNGHYSNGKQRFFCYACRKSFHWKNEQRKRENERIWFEQWIIEGYSVRQLSKHSSHSQAKLKRIINYWLASCPPTDKSHLGGCKHVILDGTFLHRPVSIVTLMDAKANRIISGKFGISENSITQLASFLRPLKDRGLSPLSCTLDGNPQMIRVVKEEWPNITIQRCLVHIQRQGLMWCRRYPKGSDAKKLRDLFRSVTTIYTKEDRDRFLSRLFEWEEKYGRFIAIKPEKGRVFSDIKRARSMLLKALPNMFHYLENMDIPSTTNGLEGYFSRLKGHYRNHRGLKPTKRNSYFSWYFYLRPR